MTTAEIKKRLRQAIDTDVSNWRNTRLSELEQYLHYNPVIEGVLRAALYILPTDDYLKFSKEIQETYGTALEGPEGRREE